MPPAPFGEAQLRALRAIENRLRADKGDIADAEMVKLFQMEAAEFPGGALGLAFELAHIASVLVRVLGDAGDTPPSEVIATLRPG